MFPRNRNWFFCQFCFEFDLTVIKVNHLSSNRSLYIQVQEEEMGNEESNLFMLLFSLFRSNESDFHYIKSYCPYQNIRDKVWFFPSISFVAFLTRGGAGRHSLEGGVLP